jgi:general stress protein 26
VTTRVASFDELAEEFHRRTARIVWCTLATVAPDGQPWTRVLHPIWDAHTGWVATSRHGLKVRHLAHEPRVGLTYWDPTQDVVTVQATASWADDRPTRDRIWQLLCTTAPPLGYDPAEFWPGGPTDPAFGLLRLDPTRIEITGLASAPGPRMTWRPKPATRPGQGPDRPR